MMLNLAPPKLTSLSTMIILASTMLTLASPMLTSRQPSAVCWMGAQMGLLEFFEGVHILYIPYLSSHTWCPQRFRNWSPSVHPIHSSPWSHHTPPRTTISLLRRWYPALFSLRSCSSPTEPSITLPTPLPYRPPQTSLPNLTPTFWPPHHKNKAPSRSRRQCFRQPSWTPCPETCATQSQ
jgi:hypothetical protein